MLRHILYNTTLKNNIDLTYWLVISYRVRSCRSGLDHRWLNT